MTYFRVKALLILTSKGKRKSRPLNFWSFSSVQLSHSVVSDSLWPHGLQQARLLCPSPPPRVCSNSCPLSQWYHPTISSCHLLLLLPSIFSSTRVFSNVLANRIRWTNIGASASALVLPVNIQSWFPLVLIGVISLLSKGLSGVFFNTTVQRHQFFGILLSLWFRFHNSTWPLGRP